MTTLPRPKHGDSIRAALLRRLRLLAHRSIRRYLDAIDASSATRGNPLAAEPLSPLDEARRTAGRWVE
ncbi:hypothetical protein ACFY0R_10165 [Streptomyces sp. NPDC001633]|uniref:hypothetical protein n=1 Tax=Streptomyces sp. NPDC001633 TaxID=3364595 RepID=UPI0036C4EDDE